MHLTIASVILFAQLVLGAPSAAAAPRNLRVVGASVLGSGCPYGTADVKADPSNTAFDIRLSDYVVRAGPNTMAADWRKNCKLTLNLEYDEGFQYVFVNIFPDLITDADQHRLDLLPSRQTCRATPAFHLALRAIAQTRLTSRVAPGKPAMTSISTAAEQAPFRFQPSQMWFCGRLAADLPPS